MVCNHCVRQEVLRALSIDIRRVFIPSPVVADVNMGPTPLFGPMSLVIWCRYSVVTRSILFSINILDLL